MLELRAATKSSGSLKVRADMFMITSRGPEKATPNKRSLLDLHDDLKYC